MNYEREINRKSIAVKSSKYVEVLKMSIWSGYDNGLNRVIFDCESPKSPISIKLEIDENSQDFRDLVTSSMSVTQEFATRSLARVRQEQRRIADNYDLDVSFHTESTVGSLVLAHFSPRIDFSFGMLNPEAIDNLKFLALEHTHSSSHAYQNELISVV